MTSSERERERLDSGIARVLREDACSGCGACTLLDEGLAMRETTDGYLRPVRVGDGAIEADAAARFGAMCPGVVVRANSTPETREHALLGRYVAVWRAWATDPDIRFTGSSGGALTALATWLLESGEAERVIGAVAGADPRRSVPLTLTTREQALASAGSRYTPVATLSDPDVLRAGSAIIAKPCEASALSALTSREESERGLLLSFFCAGTPSAHATDRLLAEGGIGPDSPVDRLRYRGHGWPGDFTAVSAGATVRVGYDESWGRVLGPTTQWRCKVCADGVGESADIVAADYWETDERGYPSFADGDGVSALIARTARGRDAVLRAAAAGALHIDEITMDSLAAVQPLQRDRRRFLAARLAGARLAGRRSPRFRGFGLLALSLRSPRQAIRTLRGTYRRVRAR